MNKTRSKKAFEKEPLALVDPGIEQYWRAEVLRRQNELKSGDANLVSRDNTLAKMEDLIGK